MKRERIFRILAGLMLSLLGTDLLLAAPGTLAQTPLYVGPAVEPNIVILSDDSGSMDWEVLSRDHLNGGRFTATQPDGSNPSGTGTVKHRDDNDDGNADCTFADGYNDSYIYGVEFSTNSYPDNSTDCYTADEEAWRFRNSDFNLLYFNPSKHYGYWAGVDINGIAYTNAIISHAPNDPYNPTEWIDLAQHNSDYEGPPNRRRISDRDNDGNPDGFRYYTWNDIDSDGNFDNGEETEYQIRDQSTTIQQNFANWFTYHRSREFVAKYAISKAVEGVSGIRLGYGTLNNNNNVNIKVSSMNNYPGVGNKKILYDRLFQTTSRRGTALRENLRDIGRYFECVTNNFFAASGADCPILPAQAFGQCQKNVSILITDGFYNGADPGVGNTDGSRSDSAYDNGNYADDLSDTLADVAMHYYERDLRTDLANEVPPSGTNRATHQHMTTFTIAFGVTGDLDPNGTKTATATDTDPTNSAFAWPSSITANASKIDDLWHAAFNGRGAFFSAQTPDALTVAIRSAVASAAKGSSSSTTIAFNTTTLNTGTVIYQARFNPSQDWKGELIASRLNLDGTIATTPLWNTGTQLNNQAHSNRQVITYKDDSTLANAGGIPFKTLTNLSVSQQADLNTGPAAVDSNGQARLDYLRGDRSNESSDLSFRNRTHVLGDIVHSNPVYVGKPQMNYPDATPFGDGHYSSYKASNLSRTGLIYVGANDGMLHAFHEDSGNAVFSYIPSSLFSSSHGKGLHYLTDQNYTHRYYVDLSPTISDVYFHSAWRTILVGGLRAGGRGLFALDISDPNTLANAENNAANIVLWEFSANDDTDLGYTTSKPTITMMENNKWAVVFGNGYNSSNGEAKLFILYIDEGIDGEWTSNDYIKITTTVGTSSAPNGLSTPQLIDADGNGKTDRAYAGDLEGNMWAFDLSSTSDNHWEIAYQQGNTLKPLFTATDASGTSQPITSRPVLARQHPTISGTHTPNLMVFFGTGQYLVNADKTNINTQSLYGIWDNGNHSLGRRHLLAQTVTVDSTTNGRVMSDHSISYSTKHGWYVDLPDSGERIVDSPQIRGGHLFFNTLIPGTELCMPQGSGWLMAISQQSGGGPHKLIFDRNNDGVIDSADQINNYNPAGIKIDGIPAGFNFLSDRIYILNDAGDIDLRKTNIDRRIGKGRLSWQEITH